MTTDIHYIVFSSTVNNTVTNSFCSLYSYDKKCVLLLRYSSNILYTDGPQQKYFFSFLLPPTSGGPRFVFIIYLRSRVKRPK